MSDAPPFANVRERSNEESRRRAKVWENDLLMLHNVYRSEGKADVERCHEETKFVGGRWIKSGKGAPDFMGTLAGGRAIRFDAKCVLKRAKFYWSDVPDHQQQSLLSNSRMGGISLLLIRFVGFGDYAFLITPESVGPGVSFVPADGRKFLATGWWPLVQPLLEVM